METASMFSKFRGPSGEGVSTIPFSGIFILQDAKSALRNPPKARPSCNPPQSAIRHVQNVK
eukprot:6901870-Alexandrium_andersonii.AAC.1